ncbi:hypothetical protein [Naasia lichenicola]|uniref:Uncharacterized protein n=1 Tax=Naasia lichenicola TaxID=2565933 RepID=A0A4S4FP94_9MICO|nr:hypothetical protein [Naasia lichenicola]THG32359.1 hypothetical protein E6C64_04905 [Naasia lichenicola]
MSDERETEPQTQTQTQVEAPAVLPDALSVETDAEASENADAPVDDEQVGPSIDEEQADQARARGQSAYTDPFTAIPIA